MVAKMKKYLEEYGLSPQSVISVMDCVETYQNYEKLPQASKDEVQIIADLYNVIFTFTNLKRKRLALIGIHTKFRATYLYTKETLQDRYDKKYWMKNYNNFWLLPGADNKLIKEPKL